ncbi:CgeB family protein [Paracoccus sp. T5]|uniref:CgeB family protein n=1 Tax=Paracoccus sp. T5 TaxID=3402161 RepID=UPI003AEB66EC
MRFLFYTHSLVSDWNHGNAHFLRGVMRALNSRGHGTLALEPEDSWSRQNLIADGGQAALDDFARTFPDLRWQIHDADFDHEAALDQADVVIVHEWTDPALVARIGRYRRQGGRFTLMFHDTHHRAVSAGDEIGGMDLAGYDGVLAFGEALREQYLKGGWGRQVFTWHEAADTTLFHPLPEIVPEADLIWVGNWGDGERSDELEEFLIGPVEALELRASVHGVRYPDHALDRLRQAGIAYRGWMPNARVPQAFARHRVTVHVPRRPYVTALPGIPTIRPFEALACGIPLVSAPWHDAEGLFRPGDIRFVGNGQQMRQQLRLLLNDPAAAAEQAQRGLQTILDRHTCDHRVEQLLAILTTLQQVPAKEVTA